MGRSRNRGALEVDIARGIMDWLASKKYFFWRSNNIPVFVERKDGTIRPRSLPKYALRGLPDIMLIHDGKFICFEVKRPSAKLRPEQAEFGTNIVMNGGHYHRVTCIQEVEDVLRVQ